MLKEIRDISKLNISMQSVRQGESTRVWGMQFFAKD